MVIDCHVHLSQFAHDGQNFATIRDDLLTSMRAHGIQYSCVCPDSESDADVADLDTAAALTCSRPDLLLYGSTSLPEAPAGMHDRLERLAADGAIIGLKLYPGFELFRPSDAVCYPFYELCMQHELPVLFHSGESMNEAWREEYNSPEEIARVAELFPSLNVIAAHFSQPHLTRCLNAILQHPNYHADISGLVHPSVIEVCGQEAITQTLLQAVTQAPHQVLFGTDWPICDVRAHLELVDGLDVNTNAKELVFSGNASRLFGIPRTDAERREEPTRCAPIRQWATQGSETVRIHDVTKGHMSDMETQTIHDLALRFQQSHFPHATLVLLTGSWATNSAHDDSDIDLFILDPTRSDVLFEGVLFGSWLFDVCAVSPDQVNALFQCSIQYRSGPTIHQLMAHQVIAGTADDAAAIVDLARTVIATGPTELPPEERDDFRWKVSTQLVELQHVAPHELPGLSAQCYCLLAKALLALNRQWQGEGKSLHRLIARAFPELTERLDAALITACSGDPAPLLGVGQEVLEEIGGSLRTFRETYTPKSA